MLLPVITASIAPRTPAPLLPTRNEYNSHAMNAPSAQPARRRRWIHVLIVLAVALACAPFLLFPREQLARYKAWRLTSMPEPAERETLIADLQVLGTHAKPGIEILLQSPQAQDRIDACGLLESLEDFPHIAALQFDHDARVQVTAIRALAEHRDDSVIPTAKWLYATGDIEIAAQAADALRRIGSDPAIAALSELVDQPASPDHRSALIDALLYIRQPACVPPLLRLLTDDRSCTLATRLERKIEDMQGFVATNSTRPGALQTIDPGPTVAQRAAFALRKITGIDAAFSAEMPADERAAAIRAWTDWHALATEHP